MNKVEIVEEEEKKEKVAIGSLWEKDATGEIYILANLANGKAGLIQLDDGGIWNDAKIEDVECLTKEEWSELCGESFTRIFNPIKITPEG